MYTVTFFAMVVSLLSPAEDARRAKLERQLIEALGAARPPASPTLLERVGDGEHAHLDAPAFALVMMHALFHALALFNEFEHGRRVERARFGGPRHGRKRFVVACSVLRAHHALVVVAQEAAQA